MPRHLGLHARQVGCPVPELDASRASYRKPAFLRTRAGMKYRIGGPEHDQLTEPDNAGPRHRDARLEVVAGPPPP
jgi:hypothetical protein